jgi:hypothetical protein
MTNRTTAHHAPRRSRASVIVIISASAAPALWLAQMLLSYGLSADVCAGLPWAAVFAGPTLRNTLFAFDAIAGFGAIGGGLLSYRSWHLTGTSGTARTAGPADNVNAAHDGIHFLAECGLLSSLWFLTAIVFNTIASIMIAPCVR